MLGGPQIRNAYILEASGNSVGGEYSVENWRFSSKRELMAHLIAKEEG